MHPDRIESFHRERIWLALLCQYAADAPLRVELERLLALHSWLSEDHHIVFQALAGRHGSPAALRAELPARLTRLGFPDTDIDAYFAPAGVSIERAIAWLREEIAAESTSASSATEKSRAKFLRDGAGGQVSDPRAPNTTGKSGESK